MRTRPTAVSDFRGPIHCVRRPAVMSIVNRTVRTLFLCAVTIAVAAGCHSAPPANRGTSGGRMDPTRDSTSELGSKDLHSADLINATDQMAADIASRLDITNPASPPKIFVGDMA